MSTVSKLLVYVSEVVVVGEVVGQVVRRIVGLRLRLGSGSGSGLGLRARVRVRARLSLLHRALSHLPPPHRPGRSEEIRAEIKEIGSEIAEVAEASLLVELG